MDKNKLINQQIQKNKFPSFLNRKAEVVAEKLLGCFLIRKISKQNIIVRIVETEAYHQEDEASHAYHGKSKRNETMFGESGHLYVYFTYGMHYCCNVVCDKNGYGAGVLIRAVEPVQNIELIKKSRRKVKEIDLINGPAKLTKALKIDLKLKGHNLKNEPLRLAEGKLLKDEKVVKAKRIGISKAKNKLLRFYIKDNPWVSRI